MKKSQTSKPKRITQSKWEFVKQHRMLYYMLLPGLILTLVFKYFPMYGILLAFKDYNPLQGIMGSEWVGFENFVQFIDSYFGIFPADYLGIIFEPSDQHKMEEAVPTDSVRTELHFLGYRCGDVVHVPGS